MTEYLDTDELWLPDDPRVTALIEAMQRAPGYATAYVFMTGGPTPVDPGPQCTCGNADLFGCAEVDCHQAPYSDDQS